MKEAADSNPLHAETKCEPLMSASYVVRARHLSQPIVLILSGNSIRSSKSYAPACFALTFVCPISFTIQLHGSNFLSMLLQSQTAPRRFREPNKWAASRPISPVLLKVFSRSEMTKSPLMKGLQLALLALFLIPVDLF